MKGDVCEFSYLSTFEQPILLCKIRDSESSFEELFSYTVMALCNVMGHGDVETINESKISSTISYFLFKIFVPNQFLHKFLA